MLGEGSPKTAPRQSIQGWPLFSGGQRRGCRPFSGDGGDQVGFRLRRKKTEFWELYSRNLPWASEVPVPILTV